MKNLGKLLSTAALLSLMGALTASIAASAEIADAASDAYKGIGVETELSLYTRGFRSSWPPDNGGVEQMLFKEVSVSLSRPLSDKTEIAGGYRYSAIRQSLVYVEVSKSFGKIDAKGGLNLGSLHELPLSLVPGISGELALHIAKAFTISAYGETSLFIHPLISLSSAGASFDQNLLGFSATRHLRDAQVIAIYENENLYAVPEAGSRYRNGVQTVELIVATDLKSFWLNSTTGVGFDMAQYSSGGTKYKYGGLFVEELLRFRLKKAEFFTGVEITVLNFTMADSGSSSPPRPPLFGLKAGLKTGR